MVCNDRQLSQAQREAGYDQQRTGVVQALRPFSGSATIENLLDYINRELVPALRNARSAVNDVYLQVADQAPSANPLSYYFSTNTANADPTAGRVRLDASPQNTAATIRVSQENARLQDVTPWLDVMSGGPTTPLGTVTLIDAINPGRFLRFDLNTMTDQGAYWDLGVTFIEGSHDDPFVEDEAVTLGFISGVSAAGSTVPVGSLSPIATDTFLGNISGGTQAPAAVPLADVDSTSITYDAASHTFRRAALTGFAEAAANSNATTSAEPIVTYSASTNMSAERVTTSSTSITVSTAVAGQIEFQRAAVTGAIAIAANANASVFAGIRDNGSAETDRTNLNFVSGDSNTAVVTDDAGNDELEVTFNYAGSTTNVNLENLTGDQNVVDISTLRCGGSVTVESVTADYTIDGFTAKTNGFWFWFIDRRQSGTATGTFLEDISSTTTSIRNAHEIESPIPVAGRVLLYYFNGRWRASPASDVFTRTDNTFTGANVFSGAVSLGNATRFTSVISPSAISADQNDYSPTGWGTANVVRLITNNTSNRSITGALAGTAGDVKFLSNIGVDGVNASFVLPIESGSSSPANRWAGVPGTTFVTIQTGAVIWYDGTSSRWRIISAF